MKYTVPLFLAVLIGLYHSSSFSELAQPSLSEPTPSLSSNSAVSSTGESVQIIGVSDANGEEQVPVNRTVQPPVPAEPAPTASPRDDVAHSKALIERIANHFDGNAGSRIYIQVDKPLYKPGETIWFKTWDMKVRSLSGANIGQTTVELVSPKGATVLSKQLRVTAGSGAASNDFVLPDEVQGGEYTLRATAGDGVKAERAVIVSAYEAPRMKKKLEFVKKTYGAGDQVSATIEIKRPTGEALGYRALTAVVTVDGVELPRVKAVTNADGGALVKFDLPKEISSGDGLLTILVEDGGVTESISKAIPILQKKLSLAFFPEGGKMVAGLPTRLYFEAQTMLGKPADIAGRLIDDTGNAVAKFSTYKNGLGRIEFTPATGRTYKAEITRPGSVTELYTLPLAEENGCVLRSYDDFDGQEKALRVAVRCSESQNVTVAATLRENVLDAGSVVAGPVSPGVIYLDTKDAAIERAAGVARITVFDQNLNPLAERLVFRNRRARLEVKVEMNKKTYAPRDQVALSITTRDASGKAVPAELALSVVDDTVISFADDKSGHLLSRLLLEPELPGKIEEPNFYTDLTEPKSALALDLLMGVRGYRRFDWVQVLQQIQMPESAVGMVFNKIERADKRMAMAPAMQLAMPAPAQERLEIMQPLAARERAAQVELKPVAPIQLEFAQRPAMVADRPLRVGNDFQDKQEMAAPAAIAADKDFARAAAKGKIQVREPRTWAVARVFPIPVFDASYSGPRNDYRETVFWAPTVKTDNKGRANVKFVLSDEVTSFRVFSEGVGGGVAGRDETVFKSSLPFSLSAKLPLEVSAGDKPLIPVTFTNESERALDVTFDASFGEMMKSQAAANKLGKLAAGQRKSLFIPLEVTGVRGSSQVMLAAHSSGLKDEVLRSIPVAPLGFPQVFEKSGQVRGQATHEIDLGKASKGSVQATIKIYTSPLSTMMSGLDGMLREPSGCFEQTSSTNYPNVMILQYLKQHDVADPALLERSHKLLDSGYKKLASYESPKNGYEWFGGDPGHEALTAYGLLEFADMKDIYGTVDDAMLARTRAWLKSRRDGKGGYQRDAKALDSFGRASPEVTDAYITWALVLAGETGLEKEIEKSKRLAETTQDAYQLAIATGTLLERRTKDSPPADIGARAAAKLAKMQAASGAWTNADHSITHSGGSNLTIETTSLAVLALLKTDGYLEEARRGINWLQNNRGGYGQWGATQSTVLALKAMIAYDNATRVSPAAGAVTLLVDGVVVREQSYAAGRSEPILFADFDDKLSAGKHTITLRSKNGDPLPYSIAIEYRTSEPASSAAAVVNLGTRLAKTEVNMGETVRLDVAIANKTQNGQPMTLARIGIPGGLTFQNWQLKELREKNQIAFFETRAREVILYFRDIKPGEVKKLGIDLVATVPGSYTGPASSAYLYYNDSDKHWAAPLAIKIAP